MRGRRAAPKTPPSCEPRSFLEAAALHPKAASFPEELRRCCDDSVTSRQPSGTTISGLWRALKERPREERGARPGEESGPRDAHFANPRTLAYGGLKKRAERPGIFVKPVGMFVYRTAQSLDAMSAITRLDRVRQVGELGQSGPRKSP
jgi:hypothetical protein